MKHVILATEAVKRDIVRQANEKKVVAMHLTFLNCTYFFSGSYELGHVPWPCSLSQMIQCLCMLNESGISVMTTPKHKLAFKTLKQGLGCDLSTYFFAA